jgi:soluble lytic murein transglycosylase-like protein
MILIGSAALLWILPLTARAEDRPVTPVSDAPEGTQVSVVKGMRVMTNAAPNSPVVFSQYAALSTAFDRGMPAHIQSLVNSISQTHGVDPRLVAAVMKVESNYNPWARSPKGALGLMQLIPATGRRFGVQDFFDPAQNIEGGVRYLKFLSEKFGPQNLDLMLAGYNAGENLVQRLGRVPQIRETVDYVRKIRKIYKPEGGPTLVSATADAKTENAPAAAAPAPPPLKPLPIYTGVDQRGVIHFSNIGPPN